MENAFEFVRLWRAICPKCGDRREAKSKLLLRHWTISHWAEIHAEVRIQKERRRKG